MTPAELWDHADVILIGVVGDTTVHEGNLGMIYRNVRVMVEKYRKNPLNTTEVVISVLGGIGEWVEDQPSFYKYERVLVYLDRPSENPFGLDGYTVVGGLQGKFTVRGVTATNEVGDTLFIGDPFWFSTMPIEMKIVSGSVILFVAFLMAYLWKKGR